jgi:tetratricopeptide (TPR) repeat protein
MLVKLDRPIKKLTFLIALLALSLSIGVQVIRVFIASEYAERIRGVQGYEKAIAWDGANSEPYYDRGWLYHYAINSIDLGRAVWYYNQAIRINPLVAVYWLDLGKAYEELKREADAEQAFAMAVRLSPHSPQVRWEAANFWLRRGQLEKAFSSLRAAAEADDTKLNAAIDISWKVTADRERILREVIPDTLTANLRFLNFAVSKNDYAIALHAWERVLANATPDFQVSDAFTYMDALLGARQTRQAARVWDQAIAKCGLHDRAGAPSAETGLIHNGSFEKEFLNGGFDWRVLPGSGFSLSTDVRDRMQGYRSLRIEFTGKENLDFRHLYQIIPIVEGLMPVPPALPRMAQGPTGDRLGQLVALTSTAGRPAHVPQNAYLSKVRHLALSYYIKTKDLSTDQGVFWEILSYPGPPRWHVKSALYSGTMPWSEGHMKFQVDADTQSIMIRLRRLPSEKFDNLLKGTVWLDGINLNIE